MKMKLVGITVVTGLILVACSSREDPEAKNRPISIQKTQIDSSNSDSIIDVDLAETPKRFFVLTNTVPDDEKTKWGLVGLSGRKVQIRDGTELLGTGTIKHVLLGRPGEQLVISIMFPSQEVLEDLERKLGFQWPFIWARECMTNLGRIAVAARSWASSHDEALPSDFLALKDEIGWVGVLICPLDRRTSDKTLRDWSQLPTTPPTYQVVAPGISANDSTQVYLRCPKHGYAAYADGSVRKPDVR
jgi:hypothetical protein